MTTRQIMFDTEFMEAGNSDRIRLLSIALVAEDGATFYAETTEDRSVANEFVRLHVLPKLQGPVLTYPQIAEGIKQFVLGPDPTAETRFWAYFSSYDFVLLCQLFGRMVDLPKGFPFWCRDLKQLASHLGVKREDFPKQQADEHHALADARWNLDLFRLLKGRAERFRTPDGAKLEI
jgi:hypothetical protein